MTRRVALHASDRSDPPRQGLSVTEVVVGVVVLVVGVRLLIPTVSRCGSGMQRAQCINNLKQIGLALRAYEADYHALPPVVTRDATGRPLHSWRTLILPYIEQSDLHKKIDLARPWDDPVNAQALAVSVGTYRCPEHHGGEGEWHLCPYQAVVGPNFCFPPEGSRRLDEITDDAADTLMIVEVDQLGPGPGWPPMTPTRRWSSASCP